MKRRIGRYKSRTKLSRKHSRRLFTKTASRMHAKNMHRHPMRGGFRI